MFVHLLSVELRRVVVDVGDDDVQQSGGLLRGTAQVRHVQDQGVVGPGFAIQFYL